MSLKSTTFKAGTIVYYASAKFRELQMDKIMNDVPVPDFPSDRNFFVSDRDAIMGYTNIIDNPAVYFLPSRDEYAKQHSVKTHFNVTHVYFMTQDVYLMNLMDRDNIKFLLFVDPDSPFHISKANISVHDTEEPYMHIRKMPEAIAFFTQHGYNNLLVDKSNLRYSGFLMLVAATNYFNKELSRFSAIFFDYTMIELFRQYIESKKAQLRIDGWYQPKGHGLHVEYALFNPAATLRPELNHPQSWFTMVDQIPILKQRVKIQLMLIQKWRERELISAKKELDLFKGYLRDFVERGTDAASYREELEDNEELTPEKYRESIIEYIRKYTYQVDEVRTSAPTAKALYRLIGLKAKGPPNKYTNHLQSYYNRRAKVCRFGACTTPFGFEYKECQMSLDALAAEMRLYPNANNVHHVGKTVADHSIWVARAMHQWLGYIDHPWTFDIDPALRNVALIAAFLHDIGKIGDRDVRSLPEDDVKPDHPYRGFSYLMRWIDFRLQGSPSPSPSTGSIHPMDILNQCQMRSPFYIAIVATAVAMHHHLGELLMTVDYLLPYHLRTYEQPRSIPHILNMSINQYFYHPAYAEQTLVAQVLNTMIEFKYILYYFDFLKHYKTAGGNLNKRDELEQALLITLAVSAADVYGSHSVSKDTEERSIYDAGTSQILDPQILNNITQEHRHNVPEMYRGYYRFLYYTIGLKERANIVTFASTVSDPDSFLSAWEHIRGLFDHLENEVVLPPIFRQLDMTDASSFLTSLLRLLKSGQGSGDMINRKIPQQLREQLMTETEYKDPLVQQFRTHRNKGLSRELPEFGIVPLECRSFRARSVPPDYA
jgi:hypothetical protein